MPCTCEPEKAKLWKDSQAWGCNTCDFIAIGQPDELLDIKIFPDEDNGPGESDLQRHARTYEKAAHADPTYYSSWGDYLGANALCQCDGCDQIVEYDEIDEGGCCFDCQGDE